MRLTIGKVVTAIALYEVVAYAFNSYQVSKPSVVGQPVFTLPFDFISTFLGGYATATNPTGGVSGFGRLGQGGRHVMQGYTGSPAMMLPTRPLINQ